MLLLPGASSPSDATGLPVSPPDTNLRIDFNLTEERHTERFRHVLAFTVAENINAPVAMRAVEVAHVLDHAENFHVYLAEHFDGFANVGQRNDGWRSDHDGTADRNALNQSQLNVARARRQIHDEVVEFAPLRAAQKLLNHAVEHGAAPDERFVAGIEQAHGNHFQAVGFDGDDGALVNGARLFVGAEHYRDVGAVNVRVEKADRMAHIF
jgi:hypothetical protein